MRIQKANGKMSKIVYIGLQARAERGVLNKIDIRKWDESASAEAGVENAKWLVSDKRP